MESELIIYICSVSADAKLTQVHLPVKLIYVEELDRKEKRKIKLTNMNTYLICGIICGSFGLGVGVLQDGRQV